LHCCRFRGNSGAAHFFSFVKCFLEKSYKKTEPHKSEIRSFLNLMTLTARSGGFFNAKWKMQNAKLKEWHCHYRRCNL
ncbi:MAG: hypothetical protein IKJ63_00005, partial [Clostridia bacterium]|nr:hypothetical protein [Clostridia bacterium]